MRKEALRSDLSVNASENEIILLEEIAIPEVKTKLMDQTLDRLVGNETVLVLIPEKNEDYERVILSTRNLSYAKTLNANYLNIRDLLGFDKLVLPLPALDVLSTYLG